MIKIGVLALQGAVEPHVEKLEACGVAAAKVRKPEHLSGLSGIILPGGESTTMLKLLRINQLWEPLREFVSEHATLGVCAGSILLANKVLNPEQESLEAIDMVVERNAYGRQVDSFITEDLKIEAPDSGLTDAGEGVFIRAPRFKQVGQGVQILISHNGEPVMVRKDHILAASFHPELARGKKIHEYFVGLASQAR